MSKSEDNNTLLQEESIKPARRTVRQMRQYWAKKRFGEGAVGGIVAAVAFTAVAHLEPDEGSFLAKQSNRTLVNGEVKELSVSDLEASATTLLKGGGLLAGLLAGGFAGRRFYQAVRHITGENDKRYNPYYIMDPENLKIENNWDIN